MFATGSAYGMRSPLLDWSQPSSGSVSFVTASDVFRDQPVLTGKLVRLEPLTLAVLEDYLAALAEPEVYRLTGARATVDRPKSCLTNLRSRKATGRFSDPQSPARL